VPPRRPEPYRGAPLHFSERDRPGSRWGQRRLLVIRDALHGGDVAEPPGAPRRENQDHDSRRSMERLRPSDAESPSGEGGGRAWRTAWLVSGRNILCAVPDGPSSTRQNPSSRCGQPAGSERRSAIGRERITRATRRQSARARGGVPAGARNTRRWSGSTSAAISARPARVRNQTYDHARALDRGPDQETARAAELGRALRRQILAQWVR